MGINICLWDDNFLRLRSDVNDIGSKSFPLSESNDFWDYGRRGYDTLFVCEVLSGCKRMYPWEFKDFDKNKYLNGRVESPYKIVDLEPIRYWIDFNKLLKENNEPHEYLTCGFDVDRYELFYKLAKQYWITAD